MSTNKINIEADNARQGLQREEKGVTKQQIPSVEESVAKFQKEFWKISGKSAPDLDRKQDEYITQALAEERDWVHRLVKLYGTPNCDYLHHNKKQQHEGGEICPVVTEITDLLSSQDKTKE